VLLAVRRAAESDSQSGFDPMSSRVHGGLNIMMRSALRITEARELAAD
jgi:hypothetical protein